MGGAIALGLISRKVIEPACLTISDPNAGKLRLYRKMGAVAVRDNASAVKAADIIILAIKPQIFSEILEEIKGNISSKQLVISVAAGIEIKKIKKILGFKQPVVRVMPNLGAMVGSSMSAWTKSREVAKSQQKTVKLILGAVGKEVYINKEPLLDAVTAISGSGPAYFFYMAELLEIGAAKMGISKKVAAELAVGTLIGTAELLKQAQKRPRAYRSEVTSRGGTTEAAFRVLEKSDFSEIFILALKGARNRSRELRK